MNKQNREGIGKMPPAPKAGIKNDQNAAVPGGPKQPSAGVSSMNLRDHNGKTCTAPTNFS